MSKFALISVSDKKGIIPFASTLHFAYGYEIISSGGTANLLKSQNIPVTTVSEYTGSPEILGGRVKTLHPKVHAGILADKSNESHLQDCTSIGVTPIDLVVVNLYPFSQTVANPDSSESDIIEKIDIGGPTMVRAAAKNYKNVYILTNPNQYDPFTKCILEKQGEYSEEEYRLSLAYQAFSDIYAYDRDIQQWFMNRPLLNPNNPEGKDRY